MSILSRLFIKDTFKPRRFNKLLGVLMALCNDGIEYIFEFECLFTPSILFYDRRLPLFVLLI